MISNYWEWIPTLCILLYITFKISNSEHHIRPSTSDLDEFSKDSEDIVMTVLAYRDEDLSFCKEWINPHLNHPLREVMDQATVTVPLGIIPENQTSTAANVRILKECEKYMNKSIVSKQQNPFDIRF